MKNLKIMSRIAVLAMVLALICSVALAETELVYDELAAQDWDAKEIVNQLATFDMDDPAAREGGLGYFPTVMSLCADGTLVMYEFSPFLNNPAAEGFMDPELNIQFIYYGTWSEADGILTVNYICSDDTALNPDSLEDEGGMVTVEFSLIDGLWQRSGGMVPPILVRDTQTTNTEAVEWIRFTGDGAVRFANAQEVYDKISPLFTEYPQQ